MMFHRQNKQFTKVLVVIHVKQLHITMPDKNEPHTYVYTPYYNTYVNIKNHMISENENEIKSELETTHNLNNKITVEEFC